MSAFACPICEKPFPTAGATRGHISGMSDDDHTGESGPDYSEEDLRDGSEQASSGDEQDSGDGTASGGGGGDPVSQAPDTGASSSSNSSDEVTCPDCGGTETFDPEEALREAGRDPSNYEHAGYDHGCSNCSDSSGWVVWNE